MRQVWLACLMVLALATPAFAQVEDEAFARTEPDPLRTRLAQQVRTRGDAETLELIRTLPEAERARGDVRVLHAHLANELGDHAAVVTAL